MLSLGEFLGACGDAGADYVNNGTQFDDALEVRLQQYDAARRAEAEKKLDVDKLINQMGLSRVGR